MSKQNSLEAKRKRRLERAKRKAAFWGEGYVDECGIPQKWQPPKGLGNYAMRRIKEKKDQKDAKLLQRNEEKKAFG